MPNLQLMGIDLGNGDLKAKSTLTPDPIVYPSVIGQLSRYDRIDIGTNREKLDYMSIMTDQGKEFAVGKMALRNSVIRNHDVTDDKYTAREQVLLTETALNLLCDTDFANANVVLGLPIHRMDIAQHVIDTYKGIHSGVRIGFFGNYQNHKTICIGKVRVVPQPHGTLFNLILDDNGEITDRDLAKSGIAIFDIGYKTNDGEVFQNLQPIGRLTIQSKNGMHVAYNEIIHNINRSFNGLEIKPYEVAEVIKNRRVRGVDIGSLIDDAFYNLACNIITEIKNNWSDAWEIEKYIFTGGGAVLLKPYLEQVFSAVFESQTSNVEGMLKYARRIWGRDTA